MIFPRCSVLLLFTSLLFGPRVESLSFGRSAFRRHDIGTSNANTSFTEDYVEIFRDDFDILNRTMWNFDIGRGPNNDGWGNGEMQTYTDSDENAFCREGVLHVKAILAKDTGEWTSARLQTRSTFSFAFGRVDARIRTKRVDGPFAAVWALSEKTHDDKVGWPMSGEIDLFEMQTVWNFTPSTLHFHDHHGENPLSYHDYDINVEEWHIYSMEWTPDHIAFYHDGKKIGRYDKPGEPSTENWPYDENNRFYLIINNAMSSIWGTEPDVELMEHVLAVDWLSVSRRVQDSKQPWYLILGLCLALFMSFVMWLLIQIMKGKANKMSGDDEQIELIEEDDLEPSIELT